MRLVPTVAKDGRKFDHHVVGGGTDFPGVVMLPYRDGKIGLVKSFRVPVQDTIWELPRGRGESHDSEAEGLRELHEETGVEVNPDSVVSLGTMYPDSGFLSTAVYLFFAYVPADAKFLAIDEVEDAEWVPVYEVLDRIASGDIKDGFTIAAVSRALLLELI